MPSLENKKSAFGNYSLTCEPPKPQPHHQKKLKPVDLKDQIKQILLQVETHSKQLEEITRLGPKLEEVESKLVVQDQMLSKCMEHFERGCTDAFALTTAEGTSWARP